MNNIVCSNIRSSISIVYLELFSAPAPVLPTIPNFSPAATSNDTLLSAGVARLLYCRHTFLKTTVPLDGHASSSGTTPGTSRAASGSKPCSRTITIVTSLSMYGSNITYYCYVHLVMPFMTDFVEQFCNISKIIRS